VADEHDALVGILAALIHDEASYVLVARGDLHRPC